MSKLLIHLHLYYLDQAEFFIEKLGNICCCEYDLIVTTTTRNEAVTNKISAAFPKASFKLVDNLGYDIWPFLQVIRSVDLDKYDYILKLHTKNFNPGKDKLNGITYSGYEMRNALVDSYLQSKEHFRALLLSMNKHKNSGLICNNAFYKNVSDGLPEDMGLLHKELARIGITSNNLHFCAGSMFLAKAKAFKKLQNCDINSTLFGEQGKSHAVGSMAHVYERILSIVVTSSGYEIIRFSKSTWQKLYLDVIVRGVQPIFENIFSIRRIGEDRVKYLILFGIRIPLEKKQ